MVRVIKLVVIAAVIFAGSAHADYKWSGKRVDINMLEQELIDAGCSSKWINNWSVNGIISGEIVGPPCSKYAAVLDAHDPSVKERAEADALAVIKTILSKLDTGTASTQEIQKVLAELIRRGGLAQ